MGHTIVLWLGMMVPLVFSAGPANITMASLGARFGLVRSLPFIVGINLIVLIQALLIGAGAGQFIVRYPDLFQYLKYAGALYLIYLATKFFRTSRPNSRDLSDHVPKFKDGVILQMLNVKVITVTMVMFSQFLAPGPGALPQVILFSSGLALLTSTATLTWAAGSAFLTRTLASGRALRWQGYVFGTMLIGVSVWMLF